MSQAYAKKVDMVGGPLGKSRRLYGLSSATLKRHPALGPLLLLSAGSVIGGVGYLLRIGIQHPEISWFHTQNMMPWRKLDKTWRYQIYSPTRDYNKEDWPADMPKLSEK